ncbi:MAG TPA: O-methyltransferase [Anaerolineae bacterium]|nr:O-methyltransferase [Anaerolineae bacterium]
MPDLDITHPDIYAYLEETLVEDDPILREMGDYGRAQGFPIIGTQPGHLLYLLARAINAKRVLELGSGFGYSAMWFARAVGKGGKVIMTEGSEENVNRARMYFTRAAMLDRVEFNVGNALEIAPRYAGPFDIIFCDIDKHDYPKAIPIARDKLRVGGILVFDNMLWHGRVLDGKDVDTRAVLETTRELMNSDDFFTTLVPLRDGQSISLRIK